MFLHKRLLLSVSNQLKTVSIDSWLPAVPLSTGLKLKEPLYCNSAVNYSHFS